LCGINGCRLSNTKMYSRRTLARLAAILFT
jgi:hypothetical protein